MAHIPYPHRQLSSGPTASASGPPHHVVNRYGKSGREEKSARLSKEVVSAMKIWVKMIRPVEPAAEKIDEAAL